MALKKSLWTPKYEQVIAKLRSGEAVLVYSELYESVNIVDAQEYQE